MSKIELKNIDKYYGSNHVLNDINLTIEDGDFMTFLGPSGCGKTTTLRVISGLEKPQHGIMLMDGETIIEAEKAFYVEPSKRGLNLVFQSYALWPHMTVFENVAFGLKVKKLPKEEVEKRTLDSLERMRIAEFKDRYPSELSGGQQQRVAIARAVASNPRLLLLDEPLSNLDARLRIDMRAELKRLHHETGTTIIYVTHDQVEALTMSTKIALFERGLIAQIDDPLNIYTNPINLQTADFIGNPRINLIDGRAIFDGTIMEVKSDLGSFRYSKENMKLDEEIPQGIEFDVVLGVRPEIIEINPSATQNQPVFEASVYATQPSGSETMVNLTAGRSDFIAIHLGIESYTVNQKVRIFLKPNRINVYNKKTERLIKYAAVGEKWR
ncbi:ABC transporter ATP-binding protein [Enterocloster citroniae]|uniref:ABC transporter ATP-binding protein n=1 Tax=Enterocloster citroniae TaxID=358743 RepID=UPI0008E9771E|nr:ABC transporter ATP-binding protein [Enterocloster citroniae]SFS23619.1 carbohydrate ABC transporter ATP-binding protein, CUT1 family [Enterocloster citroniae]